MARGVFSGVFPSQAALLIATAALILGSACPRTHAFSYVFADEENPDVVTHPRAFERLFRRGGAINVTVGVMETVFNEPGSAFREQMVTPIENVIRTWNRLQPTTGNITSVPVDNDLGFGEFDFDFESVLLHEMGHTLGLGHPNLGDTAGVRTFAQTQYTKSLPGPDGSFRFRRGPDGVIGTADDPRGDDINLNYFRTSGGADANNAFTIDAVVDSTTYSRDLADLPAGDRFSAGAHRDIAALLPGVPDNTESVMDQGVAVREIQRTLGHDDVAGLRYARTGVDRIAGTRDDYTVNLEFVGFLDDQQEADIEIEFNPRVGIAQAEFFGAPVIRLPDRNDWFLVQPRLILNPSLGWFFNQESNAVIAVPEPTGALLLAAALASLGLRSRSPSRGWCRRG